MWRIKIMEWTNNDFNDFLDRIIGETWSNFISIVVMLVLLLTFSAGIGYVIKIVAGIFN